MRRPVGCVCKSILPEELDELDRRAIQLKIEREALKKEDDKASADRLLKLEAELAELDETLTALTARWQSEKDKLADTQKIKEQLEVARTELEQVQRKGELNAHRNWLMASFPNCRRRLKRRRRKPETARRPCWKRRSVRTILPISCRADRRAGR